MSDYYIKMYHDGGDIVIDYKLISSQFKYAHMQSACTNSSLMDLLIRAINDVHVLLNMARADGTMDAGLVIDICEIETSTINLES